MASKWVKVCDLDHEAEEEDVRADETIQFDANGKTFELDVCSAHLAEWRTFEQQQQRWQSAARVHEPTAPSRSRSTTSDTEQRKENGRIRAWAREQAIEISDRGRISDELRQRYRDAMGAQARERWDGNLAGDEPPRPTPLAVGQPHRG